MRLGTIRQSMREGRPVSWDDTMWMVEQLEEQERTHKFAALKARQFSQQAFGDSRVEDAARCFEDIAEMLSALLRATPEPPK